MAKRTATTELNHDNWEKEEEAEDAGTFRKASEADMVGRVIRKAKRRNLTDSERKNVFSGLSFSSSVAPSDPFSFLKQSPPETNGAKENVPNGSSSESTKTPESKTSGFVFGSQPAKTDSKPAFGGFVFGTPKTTVTTKSEVESEKEKTSEKNMSDLSSFLLKPGTWTCDTCMISNASDKTKCLACETPKPSAKPADDLMSKFMPSKNNWTCDACMISNASDKTKCLACETPKPSEAVTKSDDFMAKFIPSKTNWSCDSCMVSNSSDKDKCAACETPKPGVKPNLLSVFKPQAGSWSCDVCMISNKSEDTKCLACETPKPGAKGVTKEQEKTEFSFGASGGFKFQGGETSEKKSGGFVFGGSAPPAEPQTKTGGFVFGGASEPKSEPKTGGFVFGGASETKSEPKTGGFVFGGASEPKSEPETEGFVIGGASEPKSEPKTGEFVFGGASESKSEPKTGGFVFGGASESKAEAKTSGLVFGCGTPVAKSESEGFVFGGTPQSAKPKAQSNIFESEKGVLPPVFGVPKGPFGTPGGPVGAEGSLGSAGKKEGSSKRAEYLGKVKALNIQVINWIQGHVDKNSLVDLTPVFDDYKNHMINLKNRHGIQPKKLVQAVTEETKLETLTPGSLETSIPASIVEANQYFSQKCKLFYMKEGKYEERGKGTVYLKHTDNRKTQLVIRSDNSIGTILLNVLVQTGTRIERVGDNNLLLVTLPNPTLTGEPVGPVSFLIRVKNEEVADELFNHLNSSI